MKQTIKNLAKAFIGESQARNRYTMQAKIAKKEGYEQIAEIFLLTADNELEHAKWSFKLLTQLKKKEGITEDIKIEADCPTAFGDTKKNLRAAIEGEGYEHTTMYPLFSKIAKEEGCEEISERLTAIGKAEAHHKERFQKLLSQIETDSVFKKGYVKCFV